MKFIFFCFTFFSILSCNSIASREKCASVNPSYLQQGITRWLIHENGKYGFIDRKGNKIIPCQYDTACEFTPYQALVKNEGQFFYIDTNGRKLFNKTFEAATPVFEGRFAAVRISGKWGMINSSGELILEPVYDKLVGYDDSQYLWSPFLTDKMSLVPQTENNDSLSWLTTYVEMNTVIIKEKGKWGIWSLSEKKFIVRPEFDNTGLWAEGMIDMKKNNLYFFFDSTGKCITENGYDNIFGFNEERAVVTQGSVSGSIDQSGKMIISPRYRILWSYHNDLAASMTYGDNYFRFIDKKGNIAFRDSFDMVTDFHHQVSMVTKDGKHYLIDIDGKRINNENYDATYDINENGTIVVSHNGKWGMINVCGQEIVPIRYDKVDGMIGGMIEICLNGKWGFADAEGNEIIPPQYSKIIRSFDNGIAMVATEKIIDGKRVMIYEYIDRDGKSIWKEN